MLAGWLPTTGFVDSLSGFLCGREEKADQHWISADRRSQMEKRLDALDLEREDARLVNAKRLLHLADL